MLRVTLKGEVFEHFDNTSYTLREAIEVERGTGMPWGVWEASALASGSAVAMAGFAYLVYRRAGRDVPLADILSGKFPLNTDDITVDGEGEDEPEGPTIPRSEQPATSGSDT